MKKHLALVLALVMVLGSFSFVSAAPDFSDVKDTSFEEAVMSLESLNVLKGYPDGTFKPANTISRAEFAAVAVRVSGLEQAAMAAKGLPTGFSDVPAWHWASGYVGTAAKLGIVNGIGNGMFAPEAPVKYEEAITMVVRALGYEPAAQAKGGYPFGYLIVANEIDLLEDALGTQGTFATRGFVAQITFNALETEMMVQSGYGSETKYVVSGTENTKEKYLIDQMGFKSVEGRVDAYDKDDLEINMTVVKENGVALEKNKEKDKTYDVAEGFDFYRVHGATVKAWLDGDKVVLTKLVDKVMFDATEFKANADEVTLVYADKDYKLEKDAEAFYLNNKDYKWTKEAFNADYAKVVMDGNKVVWADGVTFDNNFAVVEKVDGNYLVDFNDDEYNVKDYLIVKDGKTISKDSLVEGDVVFLYNNSYFDYKGLGVVATNVENGIVTKAYEKSLRLDGDTYNLASGAQYLDDEDQSALDEDALSAFEDEGKEVKVVLDFKGDVVLIDGARGVAKISTYGAILTTAAEVYFGRGNQKYINWDFINELGEKVKFDEKADGLSGPIKGQWKVVEYKVKDNGDLDDVLYSDLTEEYSTTKVKVGDRYEANGKRLEDNTVVFLMEKAKGLAKQDVDKVFTWKDAKANFGEMTQYDVYSKDGKAKYLVVYGSDAAAGNWKAGVITKVQKIANETNDYDLTIYVDTKETIFRAKDASVKTLGAIVEFKTDDDMKEARNLREVGMTRSINASDKVNLNRKEILFDNDINALKVTNNTVIFNKDVKVKQLSDLRTLAENGLTAKVYMDGKVGDTTVSSTTDIKYIVVKTLGDVPSTPGTTGVVTYIDPANKVLYVDNVPYIYGAATVMKTANGNILEIGDLIRTGTYKLDPAKFDEVANIVMKNGVIDTLVATKLDSIQTTVNAIDTEIEGLPTVAAAVIGDAGAIGTAKSNYDGLSPAQKDFVKAANVTKLNGLVAKMAQLTDAQAAATVDGEIEGLPTVAAAVIGDAGAIGTAKTNYDALSPAQKALVKAANVTKLNDLVAKMTELTNAADVLTAKGTLAIGFTAPDVNANSVTKNLTLTATEAPGTTVTWVSSNTAIITNAGVVTQPNGADQNVTLTATITKGAAVETKVFTVKVIGLP